MTYRPTVSRPAEARNRGWTGDVGRVDGLARVVAGDLRPADTHVYACGHSGMVDRVLRDSAGVGVRRLRPRSTTDAPEPAHPTLRQAPARSVAAVDTHAARTEAAAGTHGWEEVRDPLDGEAPRDRPRARRGARRVRLADARRRFGPHGHLSRHVIRLTTVSKLGLAWTTGTDFTASAIVAGHVFSRTGVYDAAGAAGCSGSPKVSARRCGRARPAPTGAWAVVGGVAYNVRVSTPAGN